MNGKLRFDPLHEEEEGLRARRNNNTVDRRRVAHWERGCFNGAIDFGRRNSGGSGEKLVFVLSECECVQQQRIVSTGCWGFIYEPTNSPPPPQPPPLRP